MPRITISYRRDDSEVITGRLFDRLTAHYGRNAVFRDIDSIPPGADFREHISHVLDESDILLAVVGPRWLGTRGAHTRLNDESDPVRVEIETGLKKQMPVIPVLVQRTTMPRAAQLPEPLKDFAYRHAVQVDVGQDFDVHSARLIRAMDRILQQKQGMAPVRVSDLTGDEELSKLIEAEAPVGLGGGAPRPIVDAPQVPAVIAPPQAAPAEPRERRRSGGLVAGFAIGAILGAVAAASIAAWLRPTIPPDIAALATAKEAADSHVLVLQAELTGAQKKLAAAQDAADAAQKQVAGQQKQLNELQASADQAAKDLAAQRDTAAKAQAQADRASQNLAAQKDAAAKTQAQLGQAAKDLAAQRDAAARAQAQADRASQALAAQKDAAAKTQAQFAQTEKDLAAQKDIAAKAQTQAADLQTQIKMLGDQLLTEKKAHQDALDLVAQLNGKIKRQQEQVSASPAPEPAATGAPQTADDSTWTVDQRRDVQAHLIALGHLQGTPDGNFGPATRVAIKQFQEFLGDPNTGVMTDTERQTMHDMAQRLAALLVRGDTSPDGVAAAAVRGNAARYQRAWTAERGANGAFDPGEAIYWYGLAANDGDGEALTNLGTLLVRGQGVAKPDPTAAALLWWAASAHGEATAMFNLGALWEHGIGVTADLGKAKVWYQRAAAKNHPGAQAALKRLGA